MFTEVFLARYPQVYAALRFMSAPDPWTINGKPTQKEKIPAELTDITNSVQSLLPVIDSLFNGRPQPDEDFMRFTSAAYRHLGVGDEVRRFVGRVWTELMRAWTAEERIRFLEMIARNRNGVHQGLHFGSEMFLNAQITSGEMVRYIEALQEANPTGVTPSGLGACLQNFCAASPGEAISVAEVWLRKAPDSVALELISNMIGWIRLLVAPGSEQAKRLGNLEEILQVGSPSWRGVYIRSWAHSAGRPDLNESHALALRDKLVTRAPEEEGSWAFLLDKIAEVDRSSFPWALRELMNIAGPNLPATTKAPIVNAALRGIQTSTEYDTANVDECRDLLNAVLPVPASEAAIWQRIEFCLGDLAQKNSPLLRRLVADIARHSGSSWLTVLKESSFDFFMSSLQDQNLRMTICTDLCMDTQSSCRRVGLLLFDELQVGKLDEDIVKVAAPVAVELSLLEAQRTHIGYEALARLHASLAPRVDKIGANLEETFYEEVARQGLNSYAYRSTLASTTSQHSYIQAILRDVEERLGETQSAILSAALQMTVPGWTMAESQHAARMAREVGKGVRERSVILSLVPTVHLMYGGKKWRIFMHDGKLGDASELKHASHSIEVPRLEMMDPEGMQLSRLQASMRIVALENCAATDQNV